MFLKQIPQIFSQRLSCVCFDVFFSALHQLIVNCWFGARWFGILRLPVSSNPFHRGIPGIQTTGPQTNNEPLADCKLSTESQGKLDSNNDGFISLVELRRFFEGAERRSE